MGGQKYVFCRKTNSLIASSRRDNKCIVIDPETKMCRGKKELIYCSEVNFQARICKKCYDARDENIITYLDQPLDHIARGDTIEEDDDDDNDEYIEEDEVQKEVELMRK